MQFKVPQFLDIEDKIFGPFTFRQFAYLAGGAGMSFTLYKLLGLMLGILPIAIIAGLTLALTFYRPNNKPFINMLEAGFKYFLGKKLYIWQRRKVKKMKQVATQAEMSKIAALSESPMRLGQSRLRDLAWSLDVLDLQKQKTDNK
ncbi:hypothetical protein A3G06_00335 [Candidatus Nomurabacteria bacterium RIFCSPLOWO2_12_FULL_46_14]|uniref:PrgI family protein n=1 Tax=Candidatus Nomurabacteria bacterium RIFCSPLOWO2_12_FULL_46_14 TaxID=1801797 RepID=A0A1F6Y8Z7_9BACT|nr:MAG: hypothetical protein A3G06_00335 [Candidatus Nomurabacteria bacterium RIFCSPLOWO2_12_FULL_46_14]